MSGGGFQYIVQVFIENGSELTIYAISIATVSDYWKIGDLIRVEP